MKRSRNLQKEQQTARAQLVQATLEHLYCWRCVPKDNGESDHFIEHSTYSLHRGVIRVAPARLHFKGCAKPAEIQ